ncbi:hypothetical protein [Hymenobacter swuensis]|uniref:Nicotinate-nucleotide--dimethylbenzimidazole phosphoribosyltransferase n=1 Tax=Hymenobacter swuensis DY53 TaxID=1227739 RepID=W8ER22_9BACT|nr:hypothetical protein [Hymenobacter swuensis]AHJ95589.1 hypothetical protein Hsw_PA0256 [Hymenobacter swuensis DY53]
MSWRITPPDTALSAAIQHKIDTKIKPVGALEALARQLAVLTRVVATHPTVGS